MISNVWIFRMIVHEMWINCLKINTNLIISSSWPSLGHPVHIHDITLLHCSSVDLLFSMTYILMLYIITLGHKVFTCYLSLGVKEPRRLQHHTALSEPFSVVNTFTRKLHFFYITEIKRRVRERCELTAVKLSNCTMIFLLSIFKWGASWTLL